MAGKTKSEPKRIMIEFIRATANGNSIFKFRLRGGETEARNFVHRMRVALSRMRDIVKQSGRVPKDFKVLLHDIDFDPDTGVSTVTLRKSEGSDIHITAEVEEIFDDIAGGKPIEVGK